MSTETQLRDLQNRLGYQFVDIENLLLALTHRSAGLEHNQRLEFLGDAALGLVIADLLFEAWPDAPEGHLSQLRAGLVNQETLASIARELQLGDLLVLGLGERRSGGRQRDSILSDAVEAVLGAVYRDGGFLACRHSISRIFDSRIHAGAPADAKDPKTRLQELMQGKALVLPQYRVLSIEGEEHEQVFHVECRVAMLREVTRGSGRSRKLAEQNAALIALQLINKVDQDNE